MVLCDPSNQNPQNITSILVKNHDFEYIIKLRLIYETNVDKIAKKNKKCGPFFFSPREKKTEKCASGEVGRTSYVSAKKNNYTPLLYLPKTELKTKN